jgi:hypothetical protein
LGLTPNDPRHANSSLNFLTQEKPFMCMVTENQTLDPTTLEEGREDPKEGRRREREGCICFSTSSERTQREVRVKLDHRHAWSQAQHTVSQSPILNGF